MVKQLTPQEVRAMIESKEPLFLLDCREPDEHAAVDIGGLLIPMRELERNLDQIPRDRPVIIYCHSGARSAWAVDMLQKKHGFTNLANLKGGVVEWYSTPTEKQ